MGDELLGVPDLDWGGVVEGTIAWEGTLKAAGRSHMERPWVAGDAHT